MDVAKDENGRFKKTLNDKECLSCRGIFHPRTSERKFCSKECANKAYSELKRYPRKQLECKFCNIIFTHKTTYKKIYCSNECFKKGKTYIDVGERSGGWKGGITLQSARLRGLLEFDLWRNAVFIRDNWTCQKCGQRGGELNVHHIHNFADFPQLRTAIENGATLCISHHKEFHNIYGKIKTNEKQFNDYKNIWK